MKTFKYNTETGRFVTAEVFAKKRLKGNWIDVELTEAQAAEVVALQKSCDSNDRKFRQRQETETSSDALLDEHDWEAEDKSVDIQAELEKQDDAEELRQAITQLTDKRQELVRLHFYEGLSITEIAKMWGVDKAAIRQQLDTIEGQLKKRIKNF